MNMFTGIVQGIAKIVCIEEKHDFCTYTIELYKINLDNIMIGSSVSCNGCCLTVKHINENQLSFDIVNETLKVTNLGDLRIGDIINIERAAKFCDEIGGHVMSGHILTTAEIINISNSGNCSQMWFRLKDKSFMKYLFHKGYIGIDGVSLTICKISYDYFSVCIVPTTMQCTILGKKKLKQYANIEIDSKTQAIVDTTERFLNKKFECQYT